MATERAAKALETEHAAATLVADIEKQIAAEVRPADTAGPARRFLEVVATWAATAGAEPPEAVNQAADALKVALGEAVELTSPTDLDAPLSEVEDDAGGTASPTSLATAAAAAAREEERHGRGDGSRTPPLRRSTTRAASR